MWKFVASVCWLFIAFGAGSWWHQYQYGEVRVFTNVEIPGDKDNRGQKTIDIAFPAALKPRYIWLPNGEIYPDDGKPRWVEVLPSGKEKRWLDRLSFEIADRPRPDLFGAR